MNFDWTIFRLLNNSVLLSSGCLKDHENLLIGGAFLVFLKKQQGLVPLWAGIFGEVWCHPHLDSGVFSGCRWCGWSKVWKHQLSAREGASLQLHLAGNAWEWGRDAQPWTPKGHLTPHFPPFTGIWPCPLPLACWNFSGFKVFFYWSFRFISHGLKTLIENAISSSSTFHCKWNCLQHTGQWKTDFV